MTRQSLLPTAIPSLRWLVGLALLSAAGCGSAQTRNPFDGSAVGGGQDRIRIEVQNLNFNDVTIWALRQGQRIRVGRMTGKTDRTFTIEWNVAFPISFEMDFVSGRGCTTRQVGVDPNSRVWLTIPGDVGLAPCRAGRR